MDRCDHCRTRQARTVIARGDRTEFRCWVCYEVEQRMMNQLDWRDPYREDYATTHDMVQRTDETPANLHNRCKILAMKNGFRPGGSK